MSGLAAIVLRPSDDEAKSGLGVKCGDCGAHLCDAVPGDTLAILAGIAHEHECGTEVMPRYVEQSGGVWELSDVPAHGGGVPIPIDPRTRCVPARCRCACHLTHGTKTGHYCEHGNPAGAPAPANETEAQR